MSIESEMLSNHLILCQPLLLLPSIFPSIRAFSNESVLHIRWSKYWSFSFNISLSNEYSALVSFRIDWFDFLAVLEVPSAVKFLETESRTESGCLGLGEEEGEFNGYRLSVLQEQRAGW